MHGRDYVTFFGGAAASWLMTALGQQQSAMPVIDILGSPTAASFTHTG